MNLLIKYYDKDSIGGGIPDEVRIKPCPFCGQEANVIKRGNAFTRKRSAEIECSGCRAFMIVGAIRNSVEWCESNVIDKWNKRTPLASEETSRLKAENERLMGEVDIINARFKENMVRFFYFVNKGFIPIHENKHDNPINFMRFGPPDGAQGEVTIEEIVKEYFESINPPPTTKK